MKSEYWETRFKTASKTEIKGFEDEAKVKTKAMIVKTKTMFDKTKAMIDKTKAMFDVFSSIRTVRKRLCKAY